MLATLLSASEEPSGGEESTTWLITPDVGLTVWTLIVFSITMVILIKAVFPKIREALDRRAEVIAESIDAAERTRVEADALLAEYRERLAEARKQADEIVERARQTATVYEQEARTAATTRGEQMLEQTRRELEIEGRRMIDEIMRDVADLTVLATERVTRKTLTDADQRQLVEDALSDLDLTALVGGRTRES
ncbi:MAG TPA: F0F1 ATP synthase subunit B [Sporichthya sp.]|nr:F0F1 ATP synthase subunit B [Sporichthya sp.]